MSEEVKKSYTLDSLSGDIFGGLASMLVALPAAIAFGLIIYSAAGQGFSGTAVVGGIIGTIIIVITASIFGGTPKLISAPCAPAAAVLSVLVAQMAAARPGDTEMIPVYLLITALAAGSIQLLSGFLGGGRLIKYIPYPVVTGYLSGVGILIFSGQILNFLGVPKGLKLRDGISDASLWKWESIVVALVTMIVMIGIPRIIKKVPATILALISGIACYQVLALFNPGLDTLEQNPFVIGAIPVSVLDMAHVVTAIWMRIPDVEPGRIAMLIFPMLTLATLLSIDTLKTCLVLDSLTYSRHDSNRELMGQGLGNIASGLLCGIPGAGTMGATLVNINSGGATRMSGVFAGAFGLLLLLLLGNLIAWIPVAALSGILMVVGVRMIDFKSARLVRHRSTRFDYFVVLSVVLSAVAFGLLTAALVGIALAIVLFLRGQINSSVVRRKITGGKSFSKKRRLSDEAAVLEKEGGRIIVFELQGQLFFGTTDQLFTEMEKYISICDYIILDMKRVQSVDFSAANMLNQIHKRIKGKSGYMMLSNIPMNLATGQNIKKYLDRLGFSETTDLKFFHDIDAALEWSEEDILEKYAHEKALAGRMLSLSEIEILKGTSEKVLAMLSEHVKEKSFEEDEYVFRMGEKSDEICFMRSGMVKILLPMHDGTSLHIATFSKGDFFGDMSFLDKADRSANALCKAPTSIFLLSRSEFDKAVEKYPELGGIFFERLALEISHRLRLNNIELLALGEG